MVKVLRVFVLVIAILITIPFIAFFGGAAYWYFQQIPVAYNAEKILDWKSDGLPPYESAFSKCEHTSTEFKKLHSTLTIYYCSPNTQDSWSSIYLNDKLISKSYYSQISESLKDEFADLPVVTEDTIWEHDELPEPIPEEEFWASDEGEIAEDDSYSVPPAEEFIAENNGTIISDKLPIPRDFESRAVVPKPRPKPPKPPKPHSIVKYDEDLIPEPEPLPPEFESESIEEDDGILFVDNLSELDEQPEEGLIMEIFAIVLSFDNENLEMLGELFYSWGIRKRETRERLQILKHAIRHLNIEKAHINDSKDLYKKAYDNFLTSNPIHAISMDEEAFDFSIIGKNGDSITAMKTPEGESWVEVNFLNPQISEQEVRLFEQMIESKQTEKVIGEDEVTHLKKIFYQNMIGEPGVQNFMETENASL